MAESFFDKVHKHDTHTPDVLSCLANLSNDEVFTPPELVNKVLDMLPQELFRDPNAKFLDPATKTGVFLREIAKRLLVGLEPIYPDLQERIDHIFHKQLFGIAITELTSLLARRSLYCSKYPNGKYSICHFDNAEGNISFKKIPHTWKDGKCTFCGASQDMWDREKSLETHAYGFIHCSEEHNKELFERLKNMKFDVIIGNPPYQLSDGGAQASASPIYQFFVKQAKRLNPRYLTMIIPARWYSGGKNLEAFRKEMLDDTHIRAIYDFPNSGECFPGVDVKGGICIFLWNRDHEGQCVVSTIRDGKKVSVMERKLLEQNCDVFIRDNQAISILQKVFKHGEPSFSSIVHPAMTFGLRTFFKDFDSLKPRKGLIKLYANKQIGFISKNRIPKGREFIDEWKIFVPEAVGSGNSETDVLKPILGAPGSISTETYIMNGPYKSEKEAQNAMSYIKTKFFHFLLGLKKITQHTSQAFYQLIPMQDFSEPWTDAKLYKKYGLTKEEISFIESTIKLMEDK